MSKRVVAFAKLANGFACFRNRQVADASLSNETLVCGAPSPRSLHNLPSNIAYDANNEMAYGAWVYCRRSKSSSRGGR